MDKEIQSSLCDRRLDLAHAFLVATHTCAHLKHMDTNVIFLRRRHVYERGNTEKTCTLTHFPQAYLPRSSTPQRAALSLLCHLCLSNNPLPREKQSVLDLKEKGPCLYHVQLSSHQNASALVWREKCCHWGVVPFIRRLSRMEIMGKEGWRDGNGCVG